MLDRVRNNPRSLVSGAPMSAKHRTPLDRLSTSSTALRISLALLAWFLRVMFSPLEPVHRYRWSGLHSAYCSRTQSRSLVLLVHSLQVQTQNKAKAN